jgi:predicted 3-demethylubiquinone-9 3-methyltransferase (glyoxalase superfamily)
MITNKVSVCVWYVNQAEEAAKFYCSIFKNSKMGDVTRYPEGMPGTPGTVMTAEWEIEGLRFMGLNGGPNEDFKMPGSTSYVIECDDQAEVDYYWEKLLADGGKEEQCGWLTDRFGMAWQVTPRRLIELMKSSDKAAQHRAMQAMMKMVKIDVAEIERAARGE